MEKKEEEMIMIMKKRHFPIPLMISFTTIINQRDSIYPIVMNTLIQVTYYYLIDNILKDIIFDMI